MRCQQATGSLVGCRSHNRLCVRARIHISVLLGEWGGCLRASLPNTV